MPPIQTAARLLLTMSVAMATTTISPKGPTAGRRPATGQTASPHGQTGQFDAGAGQHAKQFRQCPDAEEDHDTQTHSGDDERVGERTQQASAGLDRPLAGLSQTRESWQVRPAVRPRSRATSAIVNQSGSPPRHTLSGLPLVTPPRIEIRARSCLEGRLWSSALRVPAALGQRETGLEHGGQCVEKVGVALRADGCATNSIGRGIEIDSRVDTRGCTEAAAAPSRRSREPEPDRTLRAVLARWSEGRHASRPCTERSGCSWQIVPRRR